MDPGSCCRRTYGRAGPYPQVPVVAVPNSAPTPAVKAIANAPQNVTRMAPSPHICAPRARCQPSQKRQEQERSSGDEGNQPRLRSYGRDGERQERAGDEAGGRRQCSLNRTSTEDCGDAEFVAGMCAQGVMSHQLRGNLSGKRGIEPASDVDRREFPALANVVGLQLRTFQLEVGLLGVRLGVHRHVFTCRHRHCPGDQAGDPRDHHIAVSRVRGCDPEDQARGRKDPVVRA